MNYYDFKNALKMCVASTDMEDYPHIDDMVNLMGESLKWIRVLEKRKKQINDLFWLSCFVFFILGFLMGFLL